MTNYELLRWLAETPSRDVTWRWALWNDRRVTVTQQTVTPDNVIRLWRHNRLTFNRWRTVVSGTWKYDDPRFNMSHEGAARVWHLQPRKVLFPCPMNDCVSYDLSSDKLQESWIICKLKSFSPQYLHDLNTQARRVKRCAILVIIILLKKNKLINYRHHSNIFITCWVCPVVDRIKRYA